MRLLNTTTHKPQLFYGLQVPTYIILSHRWEEDEVSYQHLEAGTGLSNPSAGMRKVLNLCEFAKGYGCEWVWIDTCCIDKTNSAELSEAINSMFKWYQKAALCVAYLSEIYDEHFAHEWKWTASAFDAQRMQSNFKTSRWFRRGWTLQELLAPRQVIFVDRNWQIIGDKTGLAFIIAGVTGIAVKYLRDPLKLHDASIACKMSWVARRHTTRLEDLAYCLLGIFDINMPLIYGEGEAAFLRLQKAIMEAHGDDESLFAWTSSDKISGIFADSPAAFATAGRFRAGGRNCPVYALTYKGLEFGIPKSRVKASVLKKPFILFPLNCVDDTGKPLTILLYKLPDGSWVRTGCERFNPDINDLLIARQTAQFTLDGSFGRTARSLDKIYVAWKLTPARDIDPISEYMLKSNSNLTLGRMNSAAQIVQRMQPRDTFLPRILTRSQSEASFQPAPSRSTELSVHIQEQDSQQEAPSGLFHQKLLIRSGRPLEKHLIL